jgi:hypothetical protein
MLPVELLRDVWLRLLREGMFVSSEEMLTLEGRGTVLGYFLSRGGYTTQWGKWTERKGEPVYCAPGAGRHVISRHADIPESIQEGFDVWFDALGDLWSDGRSSNPARLAIGGAARDTHRLVLHQDEPLRLQRRKAAWMGWEITVPNSRGAWPYDFGSIEYTRALKSVLVNRSV